MEKSYLRSYRAGERSYGLGSFSPSNSYTKSSRKFRYSGAHTTALDLTPAPAPPEMSHTARKYSSSSYSPSCRRSTSKDEGGRASADRLSAERYSGRGPSSDRLSSGYSSYSSSSRRGSSSSDLLTSTSPSPSNYSYNGYSSSYNNNSGSSGTATPTSYSNGYSSLSRHVSNSDLTSNSERNETATTATSGRYSRQNCNDLSGVSAGKYSRTSTYSRQSSTELPSSTVGASSSLYSRQNSSDATSPSPTPSTFVSGYATLDRRTSRRRKDHLSDRKSADRVLDSPAYSSSTLDRKNTYGRTFSCDLPSCRTSNALSSKYSGSNSCSNINNNNNNDNSNNKASESRGSDSRHERSPSIVAIHEGLARINKALQKHKQQSPEPQTSSTLSGRPAAASSSYYSSACDPSAIRAALGTCRSPNMRSPRGRVNHFASLKETSVEGEANVVPDIVIPAEARLAQRRAARAEARELRLRELEKQQQDQENEEEKQFGTPAFAEAEEDEEEDEDDEEESQEPSPRAAAPTRTPLSRTGALSSAGQFSRRSSEDSTTDDSALPANVREMRAELKELDEKFRKAMITNAQLDNEKATLTFEVELMKDKYTELEETHTQLSKEHRKKCTEYEQLKKVATKLQEEVKALRALLQERDALIQEYGLVVVGEEENGEADIPVKDEDDEFADMDDLTPRKIAVKKALLSQEAADLLSKGAAQDSLDVRLKKFGEEKKELEDQVRRLKLELEEEKNKNRRRKENGLDYDRQKEQNKTVNEYKFRVQKAEAEVSTLQANVARLDALSARYRTQSEELEKSEEELKSEKRKLQRELRDAQNRLEELETTNSHLIKRFDKLKNARSTLLKDLSQDPA
ncbi:leucine-rich repeat flightless-interacting protein 2-like isoform X5 [Penaeus monodon]|uniref:leucine-rich repeat flightless-interacting protein 2-like isoform X5 n=1 Tax=Penaeus monodon TaxID=6687 RepID=UPI0018A7CC99|nr:leucine-rich repeat flightless-interacting protein 2-like isoform X5 [Penaeus monodon]